MSAGQSSFAFSPHNAPTSHSGLKAMRQLLLFVHLAAAVFWMGGMGFLLLALRPALHAQLQPPLRLPLIAQVLARFFAMVGISAAVLLASGVWLLLQAGSAGVPPGWHTMAGLGLVMVLIFGHIWFAPYRRLRRAVAASDWPAGGKSMGQITLLARINFAIGWLAIAAVMLWR
jgi:uncharacterized membrane protein